MDLFSLTRRWFLILREKPLDDHGSHLCPFKALDQRIIIKDHSKYHWMSMEKIIDIQDTVSFKHLFVVFLLFSVPISFSIFFHDINIYWISFKHISLWYSVGWTSSIIGSRSSDVCPGVLRRHERTGAEVLRKAQRAGVLSGRLGVFYALLRWKLNIN